MSTATAIDVQTLRRHAARLEDRVLVGELCATLWPEGAATMADAGSRFVALLEPVQKRPRLGQALMERNDRRIREEWAAALHGGEFGIAFYHALAVFYREAAVATAATNQTNAELFEFSAILWTLLLESREFWDTFSLARFAPRRSAERTDLDEAQKHELLSEGATTVLAFHTTQAARRYTVGQVKDAAAHLRCAAACAADGAALLRAALKHGLRFSYDLDRDRIQRVQGIAHNLIDTWAMNVVRDADTIVDDPEAIKRLPSGISRNFHGGIQQLERFCAMGVPVMRVLRTALGWHNDWSYCLYALGDLDQIRALMKGGRRLADMLEPLCTKSNGHAPENQALSKHFMLRGFTAHDPAAAKNEYETALAWNPGNQNAKDLLGGAVQEIIRKQLAGVHEHLNTGNFDKAYAMLDGVERELEDQEEVKRTRAVVCFTHAQALAKDGSYVAALTRAREAQGLETKDPEAVKVIKDFVRQLTPLAPEEETLRHLRKAREAFDKERYDQAIQAACHVTSGSKFYGEALRLSCAAYFHRAIVALKDGKFDSAQADLNKALELNTDKEERAIIKSQLEQVTLARAGKELESAFKAGNFAEAERILRGLLKGSIGNDLRSDLQKQLSQVLNARAVELANKAQAAEQKFGEALQEIVAMAKSELGV